LQTGQNFGAVLGQFHTITETFQSHLEVTADFHFIFANENSMAILWNLHGCSFSDQLWLELPFALLRLGKTKENRGPKAVFSAQTCPSC